MKKNQGIYKIVCTANGKSYIGASKELEARKASHFLNLKSGKHHNKQLQKDFNKYGKGHFVFSVIEYVSEKSDLSKIEFHHFNAEENLYNTVFVKSNFEYSIKVKISKVLIRTDEKQRKLIEKRAAELDMSLSDYFRRLAAKDIHEKILKPF